MNAGEDVASAVVESNYDTTATVYELQPLSKSVVKPLSGITGMIKYALSDLSVATKSDVEAIFENCLSKWTYTLWLKKFTAI